MSELQIVVFNLNNEVCGVDTGQVKQTIRYSGVNHMPGMPDFVDGVINLRGKAVPVINLNKKLDLGDTEITKKTKIVITEIDGQQVGFSVNDVTELIKLSADEIESLPDFIHKGGNAYLKKVGKKGERIISILELGLILNDSELQQIRQ